MVTMGVDRQATRGKRKGNGKMCVPETELKRGRKQASKLAAAGCVTIYQLILGFVAKTRLGLIKKTSNCL